MTRIDESAPHEIMLVVDAGTGQNALNQAREFNQAVGLTGITVTSGYGTDPRSVHFQVAALDRQISRITVAERGTGNGGGSGGSNNSYNPYDSRAGYGGYTGTGASMVIYASGNLTVASGGEISTAGRSGQTGGTSRLSAGGGGGSGGGTLVAVCNGTFTNSGTVTTAGGSTGSGKGSGSSAGSGGVLTGGGY